MSKEKKVFDVVRPGKTPAAPTSRPVITGHKPQVPDDQFVPGANTRLASDPSEKRPLMDSAKKVGLTPPPATDNTEEKAEAISAPELPESAQEAPKDEFPPDTPDDKRLTLEQLVVSQTVDEPNPAEVGGDAAQSSASGTQRAQPEPPMTQDEVLAETDAPTPEHAVISHHKHHTKLWEWLLIFLLIVILALVALNFLLDASVVTTELDLPHTDLLKD